MKSRAKRARALEKWAERVEPDELRPADTTLLRQIAELADRRAEIEEAIAVAVRAARRAQHPWSAIGAMLGVSKQAAQQRYGAETDRER
jgi:hypothetical protein